MHVIPRKRRIHPAIERAGEDFSSAMHDGDFKSAARIAFRCALEVNGAKLIVNAMARANSFFRRKQGMID